MKVGAMEFPENQLITFKLSGDNQVLSPEIKDEIVELLSVKLSMYEHIEYLRTEFRWTWKTERGTLPKRLETWYYQGYKESLGDRLMSEIGNIARKEIPKDQTYHFDFTKTIDWDSGEFGDSVSCFWNKQTHRDPQTSIRTMNSSSYYGAVRFFKEMPLAEKLDGFAKEYYPQSDKKYVGVARALFNTGISWRGNGSNKAGDVLALINGYGYDTNTIANVIAYYAAAGHKRVYGDASIHINGAIHLISRDTKLLDKADSYRVYLNQ